MPNHRKPESDKVDTMNVSIPKKLKEAVSERAKQKGMSRSAFVAEALEAAFQLDNGVE